METEWRNELNRVMKSARSRWELGGLLQQLLTPKEYSELSRRWQIVKLLIEGETQRAVQDKVKVAIATVERGAREVKYGSGIVQKFYRRLYAK